MYDYNTISTTTLESFLSCPAQFKFRTDNVPQCNSKTPLIIWTLTHTAVQSTRMAKLRAEKEKETMTVLERSYMNELFRHVWRYKRADVYEERVEWVIDGIKLTWHIDEIHIWEDPWWGWLPAIELVDTKTSASKWDDEMYSKMKQRFIYPYLFYLQTWCEDITFTYRVFPKKKVISDNDIKTFSEKINLKEAEHKIKWWIAQYKRAIADENFPCAKGMHCFFCWHREVCKWGLKRRKKIEVDFDSPALPYVEEDLKYKPF